MRSPSEHDHRIRALLAAGDLREASAAALRAYGPSILRYLRSLLRDEADAADAFSEFAEVLWTSLPQFRGESSLRTWAYRIAWSVARNVRDEAWRRRVRRLSTGEASAIAAEVRSSAAAAAQQRKQTLDALRAELPLPDQTLLVLRVDQELSWAEVATVMSGPSAEVLPATLMKRFERVKERLARLARERGLIE